MMNITIYSKPMCPSCVKAKNVFKNLRLEFTEKTIGSDIQPSELMQLFEEKGLPQPRNRLAPRTISRSAQHPA